MESYLVSIFVFISAFATLMETSSTKLLPTRGGVTADELEALWDRSESSGLTHGATGPDTFTLLHRDDRCSTGLQASCLADEAPCTRRVLTERTVGERPAPAAAGIPFTVPARRQIRLYPGLGADLGELTNTSGVGYLVTQRGVWIFTFLTYVPRGGMNMIDLDNGRLVRARNSTLTGAAATGTVCWM